MSAHCTRGVGCDETGMCYAAAHGDPSQCGCYNHTDERAKAERDAHLLGMGFLIDELHVSSDRVTMIRKKRRPQATILSRQETNVMDMLIAGLTTKQMAHAMGISDRTVEKYRCNAIVKLGALNFVHAAVLWDRERRDRKQT